MSELTPTRKLNHALLVSSSASPFSAAKSAEEKASDMESKELFWMSQMQCWIPRMRTMNAIDTHSTTISIPSWAIFCRARDGWSRMEMECPRMRFKCTSRSFGERCWNILRALSSFFKNSSQKVLHMR